MSNPSDLPVIYYENWLMRKEAISTWIEYWVVVRGRWLQFFKKKSSDRAELAKTLELTKFVQCSLVKRTNRRFPFSIDNGFGTYYVKCDTELTRYHWIFSILSAATEQPLKPLPQQIPISMKEEEAFKKSTKKFQKRPPFAKPVENNKEKGEPSKRRQKYAKRVEDRIKKKEEKKLAASNYEDQSRSSSVIDGYESQSDELRRTKRISLSGESASKHLSVDKLRLDEYKEPVGISRPMSGNARKKESNSSAENKQDKNDLEGASLRKNVIVHAPSKTQTEVIIIEPPKNPTLNTMDNYAFQDDENVSYSKIFVSLSEKDGVLPNAVIDSSSDEEMLQTTAPNNLNSMSNFHSMNDLSKRKISLLSPREGNFKASLERIASKTVLTDDESFEQRDAEGHVRTRSRSSSLCSNKSFLNFTDSIL